MGTTTPPTPRQALVKRLRKRGATRILVASLAAALALGFAASAQATEATWDGYHASTQAPTIAGNGVKAFAQGLWGPNPLHANRTVEFRVARNISGVVTYSTVFTIDASNFPFPTSSPGTGASGSPIGFPCNTTTTTTYVPQVRIVNTTNGGGSGWVSGPGVNLACRT